MSEMILVGEKKLIGEIISVRKNFAIAQVFEDVSGLKPGEPVYGTGKSLSVELGPGLLGGIFDGIERPLQKMREISGTFIGGGICVESLDRNKLWEIEILVKPGDYVKGGQIIAQTPETRALLHKIMIPPGINGKITEVCENGSYNIEKIIATVKSDDGARREIKMYQEWPIRVPRPVARMKTVDRPLVTGQRVIDALFPVGKGGMAAIPGGFGTGKTMIQHQLAKWSDADLIAYIGCGERGNEMTQVLEDFSKLTDPRTGARLMDRTILIANVSNMPVAAREASIFTGITIAEYFRDMGYHAALMADSTSRWAEALRELSGRLEEMPAEEGFPAYLASRLASFYERAGCADVLSGGEGSVTIIGAVSPQGGDYSEPVTQNTKRFVRAFWTLDRSLAYARHFPAVQWLTSYSEYIDDIAKWHEKNTGPEFLKCRAEILKILIEESELMEIVKLIGAELLPDGQKLTLEISRALRVGFVQQNAYHEFDSYVPLAKQLKMAQVILYLNEKTKALVAQGVPMSRLKKDPVFEKVIAMKYNVPNDRLELFDEYFKDIDLFYKNNKF
jgi:V/A-type H+-transporting ATPase subunit A